MKQLKVIVFKELLDLSRDRKTFWMSLFLAPLMTVGMLLGMGALVQHKIKSESEKPLEIAIVGAEHAPNLIAWLQSQEVGIKDVKDPDAAILNQDEDVYLRVVSDYPKSWNAGEPAQVEVVFDSTRDDSAIPRQRLITMLRHYSAKVGALRLLARGVDPQIIHPLRVDPIDLAKPESKGRLMAIKMIPYLLLFGSFIGAMAFVIDVTAGERERDSIEPLLTTPVSRGTLVSAKIVAASIIGLFAQVLICVSCKLAPLFSPGIGEMMNIDFAAMLWMLLILIPLVLLGNTLLTVLAAHAKTVKEVQSYVPLLTLMPMVPGIILMINPVKNQPWMYAVPFLAQNQMLEQVLRGDAIPLAGWLIYYAASSLLVVGLWYLAILRYRSEKLAISG